MREILQATVSNKNGFAVNPPYSKKIKLCGYSFEQFICTKNILLLPQVRNEERPIQSR